MEMLPLYDPKAPVTLTTRARAERHTVPIGELDTYTSMDVARLVASRVLERKMDPGSACSPGDSRLSLSVAARFSLDSTIEVRFTYCRDKVHLTPIFCTATHWSKA